ncbi:MAG: peptidase [Thermoanaerobaculia bacterium]
MSRHGSFGGGFERWAALALTICGATAWAAEPAARLASGEPLAIAPDVERRLAKFARTPIDADLGGLAAGDRKALDEILLAARELNDIFRLQVSRANPQLERDLAAAKGPLAEPARRLFRLMQGPWDRLDEDRPFLGATAKPAGAGFYPEDLTQEEFDAWLAAHPGDRAGFLSERTLIVRDGGALKAVPYSVAFRVPLELAAGHLRAAAALTGNASLRKFLESRAAAFLADDYYASEIDWMDLDAPVEVTIGPYETYEDALFGYKASFEAFVTVALPKESAALARYKQQLPWLESNLPIADDLKNKKRGSESPIRVVDEVYTAGEAASGVKTIAFNLPNDERVREAKGSKKVLLHNVIRAKFEKLLLPIAERVLSPEDARRVAFEAFFDETLHHELAHGLGPGTIVKDGKPTEVRLELKELFSTLEEAKADVMGVYDILALIERGEMPKELRAALDPTYVAGLFRAARFGVKEAHGQGVVSQFNYLMERGAIAVDSSGRFRTVAEKFPDGIRSLLHDMLMLQANGDYAGTRRFLETYGQASPALLAAIDRLQDLPVDLEAVYSLAPK